VARSGPWQVLDLQLQDGLAQAWVAAEIGAAAGSPGATRKTCSYIWEPCVQLRVGYTLGEMVKAYVLIITNPGKTKQVLTAIRALKGIVELHEVMGPYDIVAEVEAEQLSDIPAVLSEGIRPIDGIESTTSLVAFPE
jgi:DNA-binding Lrp family transcriptional regulator